MGTSQDKATQPLTRDYIASALLVNGKPADRATVNRIFSANKRTPKTDNIAPLHYNGFNLMR
jgi:hypothetical protein